MQGTVPDVGTPLNSVYGNIASDYAGNPDFEDKPKSR